MVIRIQDLYTFHIVARTGTMQDAASEFGVTPGAISQRISSVEERHGLRLFDRSKNGVELTEAGLALQSDISAAFAQIEKAHEKHFGRRGNMVRVSAPATFAHAQLVSTLGRFADAYPNINISVETEDRLVDLHSEPIDLAIRHGLGKYAGVRSEWLYSPELVLVASPALLGEHGPLSVPDDCLRYKLLAGSTANDWRIWFEANGVDANDAIYGTAYDCHFLTVKAAIEGQGLALLSDIYVKEALATGHLVRALDIAWPTSFAYYAVARPETHERPSVSALVNWLKKDLV